MDAKRAELIDFAANQARLNPGLPIAGPGGIAGIVADRFGRPMSEADVAALRKRISRAASKKTKPVGQTDAIRHLMMDGSPRTTAEVATATGIEGHRVSILLPDMARRGVFNRVGSGMYQMTPMQCSVAKIWKPGMTLRSAVALVEANAKASVPVVANKTVRRATRANGQWQVDTQSQDWWPEDMDLAGWLAAEATSHAELELATKRFTYAKTKVREKLQQALAERA